MSRVLWLSIVFSVSLLLQAGAALAQGHLDASFGRHGIVDLDAESDPFSAPGEVAMGPNGEIYVTEETDCFSEGPCSVRVYLKRYQADGRLDRSFGAGRILVSTADRRGALAIDSAGRPLIAFEHEGGLLVLRFLPDGSRDPAFGEGGSSFVSCGCGLSSLEVGPSDRPLLIGSSDLRRAGPFRGVVWTFARLRNDGQLDPSFARGGLLRKAIPGYYDPAVSLRPDGVTTLYGLTCCRLPGVPFVWRMSRSGSLDGRYAAATKLSLHGLPGTRKHDIGWETISLVQQAGRKVLMFASGEGLEGELQGLAVKLRANGSRDTSFGKRGIKSLGFEVTDATPDGVGGTLLAGYLQLSKERTGEAVFRMRPDGRIDPSFGRVTLPRAGNQEGIEILSQGRGAAIVYDQGIPSCRESCEDDPKLYRVVESNR
jgi:uncharacterized delta-60 repeat protein